MLYVNVPWPTYEQLDGFVVGAGVSKHFYTVFDIAGIGEVLLVGVHLKAQPTTPLKCAQREAQAAVLINLIRKHALERWSILDGFFCLKL